MHLSVTELSAQPSSLSSASSDHRVVVGSGDFLAIKGGQGWDASAPRSWHGSLICQLNPSWSTCMSERTCILGDGCYLHKEDKPTDR